MGETFVSLTPRLRRYAHALLGTWPPAPKSDGETALRTDQNADDLLHEALLDSRRAQGGGCPAEATEDDLLRLYQRVTALARRYCAREAVESIASAARDAAPHFAWAPEARALNSLPLDLRAALALVVIERLTYRQAGVVLEMPAERTLARLTVARTHLANSTSGRSRSHLVAAAARRDAEMQAWSGGPVTECDLHAFVDDLLDQARRNEVIAFLEMHADITRRVAGWRRQCERLRRAFEPLLLEPLPLSLDFAAPETRLRSRSRRPLPAASVFRRLAAFFSIPLGRAHSAPGRS